MYMIHQMEECILWQEVIMYRLQTEGNIHCRDIGNVLITLIYHPNLKLTYQILTIAALLLLDIMDD